MNEVILTGRLTAKPELQQTQGGQNTARFTIAVQRKFKNANGGYDADFIQCVAWRQTAEFICKYFDKGQPIGVGGSIQTSSWDNADGKRQWRTDINVDEVDFIGNAKENNNSLTSQPETIEPTPNTDKPVDPFEGFDVATNEDDLPF